LSFCLFFLVVDYYSPWSECDQQRNKREARPSNQKKAVLFHDNTIALTTVQPYHQLLSPRLLAVLIDLDPLSCLNSSNMCKVTGGAIRAMSNEQLQRSVVLSNLLGNLGQTSKAFDNARTELQQPPARVISISNGKTSPQQHSGGGDSSTEEEHSDDSHGRDYYEQQTSDSLGTRGKRKRQTQAQSEFSQHAVPSHHQTTVEHHYHDLASSPIVTKNEDTTAKQSKKSKGGIAFPFPSVLHAMLERAEADGFEDIVSWQEHGRAFMVRSPTRFVQDVMPLFFRQTRFASFQRQLSLYGFLRLTRKGEDHGAYYHELFIRGRPDLCQLMQRTRVKGSWVRQSSSPETEPNFATMPNVPKVPPRPISKLPPLRNTAGNFKKDASHKMELTPSSTKVSSSTLLSQVPLQSLQYLQQRTPVSFTSSVQGTGWAKGQYPPSNNRPQPQQVPSQIPVASSQAPQSRSMADDDLTPLPFRYNVFDPPGEPVTLATFLLDVGFDTEDDDDGNNDDGNDDNYDTEPLPWHTPSTFTEI
jgi:hypothetical protein